MDAGKEKNAGTITNERVRTEDIPEPLRRKLAAATLELIRAIERDRKGRNA